MSGRRNPRPSWPAAAPWIALAIASAFTGVPSPSFAQSPDSTEVASPRPFVAGGYDDKPYLTGIFGRIAVGGYIDFQAAWEREDGVTEEGGFNLKRWNLLTHTRVSPRIDVWAEVEFEDGGEEIRLELAQIDLGLYSAFGVRGGMLLLPLGRFNLSHDGPRNEFTDRPLVATELVGSALSMPGLGVFGQVPVGVGRTTYELYAVNGYTRDIIDNSAAGTRLPAGRFNPEDENAEPSLVGRLAWDVGEAGEIGVSGLSGLYNMPQIDGLVTDERRLVQVGTLDVRALVLGFAWNGEGTLVDVDIHPGLVGLYASRQAGFFLDVSHGFGTGWISSLPRSSFSAAARIEGVDFDRDVAGDSIQQLTLGLHFRATPESVVKMDYRRGRNRDRFNNSAEAAGFLFSLTSYF